MSWSPSSRRTQVDSDEAWIENIEGKLEARNAEIERMRETISELRRVNDELKRNNKELDAENLKVWAERISPSISPRKMRPRAPPEPQGASADEERMSGIETEVYRQQQELETIRQEGLRAHSTLQNVVSNQQHLQDSVSRLEDRTRTISDQQEKLLASISTAMNAIAPPCYSPLLDAATTDTSTIPCPQCSRSRETIAVLREQKAKLIEALQIP